jgi:hypothetical protein
MVVGSFKDILHQFRILHDECTQCVEKLITLHRKSEHKLTNQASILSRNDVYVEDKIYEELEKLAALRLAMKACVNDLLREDLEIDSCIWKRFQLSLRKQTTLEEILCHRLRRNPEYNVCDRDLAITTLATLKVMPYLLHSDDLQHLMAVQND